jgi:hypothetical protein
MATNSFTAVPWTVTRLGATEPRSGPRGFRDEVREEVLHATLVTHPALQVRSAALLKDRLDALKSLLATEFPRHRRGFLEASSRELGGAYSLASPIQQIGIQAVARRLEA